MTEPTKEQLTAALQDARNRYVVLSDMYRALVLENEALKQQLAEPPKEPEPEEPQDARHL